MRFSTEQLIAQRYRIIKLIGEGSGGEVYKVWDNTRSTYLALKLLKPKWNDYPEFLESFLDEAKSLSNLQHPNIVRFYELVAAGELTFFLMDYVDGITLRSLIREARTSFTLEKTISIITPICQALHYAHQNQIVHCDIKPENILIDRNGNVFLTDFGIAFQKDNLNQYLLSAGTPAYISPEQVRGEEVGPYTDVYSLGIVLYEMFTLVKPFQGLSCPKDVSKNDCIRWEQVNLKPVAPFLVNGSIDHGVNDVIISCLNKNPQYRYKGTLELLAALEKLQIGKSTPISKEDHENQDFGESLSIINKKKKPRLNLLIIILTIVILILALSLVKPFETYYYDDVNACMSIDLQQHGDLRMKECVKSVRIYKDGSLRVYLKWTLVGSSNNVAIEIQSDFYNDKMYLMDNLGNRLNHVDTGGSANQNVILKSGESKVGWFKFPPLSPEADGFYFIDDDNQVQTEMLEIKW